ncbi:META domain-containing protein [uncultured Tateyamaria sp.]|uniref:META domain-containing protein n=1 Tax=uncultured Tateyamaria sp. TaxID=455651 RepID=UPI002601B7D7|nr:META domain-containing protein [uncultured Tateyamaria sp.]
MSAGATDPATQLQGTWTLTKVGDAPVPDGMTATMSVNAGQISFDLGCNTINAVPMFGPTFVRFRDVVSTKMGCPPDVAALEAQLMDALGRIDAMQVGVGDTLSFYDGLNAIQLGAQRAAP